MKKLPIHLLAFVLMLPLAKATAQTDSINSDTKSKAVFKLGNFYISRLHFYGRTDSLRSSGYFPLAEIQVGKNFYMTAAPVFVINPASQFEYTGTVATAGLRFITENKSITNLSLIKPLYRENSELVQSALKLQGLISHTWLNKIVNITLGGDIKLSDRTDYGFTVGLDHIIRKQPGNGWVFVADPTATVNAGTQQFTQTSYKRSGFLIFPGTIQEVQQEVKKFSILSYEFSIPVILAKKKWQFIASPSYVIPQNLVKIENRPDLSERGKPMFYITTGAKFTF